MKIVYLFIIILAFTISCSESKPDKIELKKQEIEAHKVICDSLYLETKKIPENIENHERLMEAKKDYEICLLELKKMEMELKVMEKRKQLGR